MTENDGSGGRGRGRAVTGRRNVVAGLLVVGALVQHGVQRHGGLAGLTVTNDQLALTATDRDHAVNRLDAGL